MSKNVADFDVIMRTIEGWGVGARKVALGILIQALMEDGISAAVLHEWIDEGADLRARMKVVE